MAVTASDVTTVHDEFANVATAKIDDAIALMNGSLDEGLEETWRDRLVRLGTAHILTLLERGKLKTQGGIGLAQRGKEVKFDISDADFWYQTEYGMLFWNILNASSGGLGVLTV